MPKLQVENAGERSAEPNVTPLIDVLLVLLIIFMAAIPAQRKTLAGQLPAPQPATGAAPAIVLEVGRGGVYAVNREPVPTDMLGRRLRAIYSGRPDKRLIVKGAPDATYQEVVTAVDIARGSGVTIVGMDTRR